MIPAYAQTVATGPYNDSQPSKAEDAFKIFASYMGGVAKKRQGDDATNTEYLKAALQNGQGYVDASGKVNLLPYAASKQGVDSAYKMAAASNEQAQSKLYDAQAAFQMSQANALNGVGSGTDMSGDMSSRVQNMAKQLKSRGYTKKSVTPEFKSRITRWIYDQGVHGPDADAWADAVANQL